MASLRESATELLARNELGTLTGKDLVDWATQVLAAGFDVPAVVTLAGLDLDGVPRVLDAMPLFQAALEELGVPVTRDPDELLRLHLRRLAREMVLGQLDLEEGVARIEREVLTPLCHPEDLMAWCYVGSELDPDTFRELTGPRWKALVLSLAQKEAGDAPAPVLDRPRE